MNQRIRFLGMAYVAHWFAEAYRDDRKHYKYARNV
jgi:hypothetical protein